MEEDHDLGWGRGSRSFSQRVSLSVARLQRKEKRECERWNSISHIKIEKQKPMEAVKQTIT